MRPYQVGDRIRHKLFGWIGTVVLWQLGLGIKYDDQLDTDQPFYFNPDVIEPATKLERALK